MNLENRFFYRLTNVMHVFSLILFFLIASTILYMSIPAGDIPDNTKSYIVCDNSKRSIPLSDAKIEIYSYSKELSYSDDKAAKDFCTTNSAGAVTHPILKEITDPALLKRLNAGEFERLNSSNERDTSLDKNYTIKISYKPKNWRAYAETIFWVFISFMIFYSVINIVRETLLYLAFGKKISWEWLVDIQKLLAR